MPDNILIMLPGQPPEEAKGDSGMPSYVLAFCRLTMSIPRRLFASTNAFCEIGKCMTTHLQAGY